MTTTTTTTTMIENPLNCATGRGRAKRFNALRSLLTPHFPEFTFRSTWKAGVNETPMGSGRWTAEEREMVRNWLGILAKGGQGIATEESRKAQRLLDEIK